MGKCGKGMQGSLTMVAPKIKKKTNEERGNKCHGKNGQERRSLIDQSNGKGSGGGGKKTQLRGGR